MCLKVVTKVTEVACWEGAIFSIPCIVWCLAWPISGANTPWLPLQSRSHCHGPACVVFLCCQPSLFRERRLAAKEGYTCRPMLLVSSIVIPFFMSLCIISCMELQYSFLISMTSTWVQHAWSETDVLYFLNWTTARIEPEKKKINVFSAMKEDEISRLVSQVSFYFRYSLLVCSAYTAEFRC